MKRVYWALIFVGILSFLVVGFWYWENGGQEIKLINDRVLNDSQENANNKEYLDTLTWLPGDNVGVDINGSGIQQNRDVILRKGMYNEMHIRITWVPEGFAEFAFQKGWIGVALLGKNEKVDLKCRAENNLITCPFTFETVGKDQFTISFGQIDYLYQFSTITQDPSFFLTSLGITKDNVSLKDMPWLKLETSQITPSYVLGDESPVYASSFYHPDLPEVLWYTFISKNKQFNNAYLEIYPIKDGLLPSRYSKEAVESFIFPSHIVRLDEVLQNRPKTLERDIVTYPIEGAIPIAVQREKYIEAQNFTGIRYILDYTQGVNPAGYPIYTFQGITNDKKYFILFRYAHLYSPNLERILREGKRKNIELDKDFMDKTFQEIYNEEKFSPSLEELDDFIGSISIS